MKAASLIKLLRTVPPDSEVQVHFTMSLAVGMDAPLTGYSFSTNVNFDVDPFTGAAQINASDSMQHDLA